MSKKKIIIAVIIIAVIAAGGTGYSYYAKYSSYLKAVKEMTFSEIDLDKIEDGVYTGSCDTGVIYAEVEVTVQNHIIEEIRIIEHRHEKGESAEVITDKMMEENRLDVDTVSGATNSSKVIRKAVENALRE